MFYEGSSSFTFHIKQSLSSCPFSNSRFDKVCQLEMHRWCFIKQFASRFYEVCYVSSRLTFGRYWFHLSSFPCSKIGVVMFDANQISDNQFSLESLRSNDHSVFCYHHIKKRRVESMLKSYDRHDFSGPLGWLTKIPKRLGLEFISDSEVLHIFQLFGTVFYMGTFFWHKSYK